MIPLIHLDFAKRESYRGIYRTHNARALHNQFPRYTLDTLYRIRKGIRPKYMGERTYLTLKLIMEHADYHKGMARNLSSIDLQVKYRISEDKVKQLNREWRNGI